MVIAGWAADQVSNYIESREIKSISFELAGLHSAANF
jgi:hypothetical protein